METLKKNIFLKNSWSEIVSVELSNVDVQFILINSHTFIYSLLIHSFAIFPIYN